MSAKLVGEEKERYVNRLFASIAPKYDLLNSVISLGNHKRWRRLAVAMSGVSSGGTALDVATGTGDFAIDLAGAVGETGRVVGVDFCLPMLDLAAQKTSGLGNISLVAANAECLPFDSDSFDCTTIGFALRNVGNVRSVVSEMARVTKPGGRVVSLEILGPESRVMKALWRLYFSRLMPCVAGMLGAKKEPYEYLPKSVERFCSRNELADIFRQCGMRDVSIRGLMFGIVCIHVGTKI